MPFRRRGTALDPTDTRIIRAAASGPREVFSSLSQLFADH